MIIATLDGAQNTMITSKKNSKLTRDVASDEGSLLNLIQYTWNEFNGLLFLREVWEEHVVLEVPLSLGVVLDGVVVVGAARHDVLQVIVYRN